jgi:uncharacterized membrane protein YobD (UPF0266 family)
MKYCKDNFSKWLLTVAMLLGVFAFSGYNNNSTLLNNVKAQTELVCSIKTKNKKFTVAFKKVISASQRNTFLNYFSNHSTTLLLTYNKLIKVQFDNISKLYQSIDQADKFVQLKNIPSNSSKDIFISIG